MKKAFTLIELLVVILMIGILAGIATPHYNRAVRRAEMVEGITHGKTIYEAAVRYRAINSVSPTAFDQIDISFLDTSADMSGNSFADGNFTYSLQADSVDVASQKLPYSIRFMYPTVNANGVYAPIACCPNTASSDAVWLCTNIGVLSSTTGMPANCYEVK